MYTDHLGSVRAVTDAAGHVVSLHNYFPFGEEIQPQQFSYNTHQYTGHERDKQTGLDYMLARYYGDSLPRFLSVDPVGGTAKSPQSWNRYAYVLGNPMKLVDPTGMYWAPGTPMPIIPGDPNGCTMCHDFEGGNPGDAAVAYFYQEQLRAKVAKNGKLLALAKSQGRDLLHELSPGHGANVDLNFKSSGDAEGGHFYPGLFRDRIGLDKSALSDPNQFEFRLLHETGHGYGRVPIDPAMQAAIDQRFRDIEYPLIGATHRGDGSEVFTWMLFGSVLGE